MLESPNPTNRSPAHTIGFVNLGEWEKKVWLVCSWIQCSEVDPWLRNMGFSCCFGRPPWGSCKKPLKLDICLSSVSRTSLAQLLASVSNMFVRLRFRHQKIIVRLTGVFQSRNIGTPNSMEGDLDLPSPVSDIGVFVDLSFCVSVDPHHTLSRQMATRHR